MNSLLMDVQPSIIRYASIISKVLKVEVEIVDSNLIRVAGTGVFKNLINKSMEKEGYVYKNAIESKIPQIIEEPGKSEFCRECPKHDRCDEKFEVCAPIKMGSEIIGVIGLVCFEEMQKEYLLKDFETYMEFLQQISDFISITVYERKEKLREQTLLKSLNLVIDKMDSGVIVLNSGNKITHINQIAMKILSFIDIYFKYEISLEELGEEILGMKEYRLSLDNRIFYIAGNLYPMGMNENQFDRILIFQDSISLKQAVSGFSSNNSNIYCNDLLGESEAMEALKRNIKKIAVSRSTVLITGESGTGKEMIAIAIHNEGNRKNGPFIAINCAAIPYELLESELFGYVKGAFTGALTSGKIGKFELANKGTIFLDEIGDMPISLQIKILRVLQDKKIVRIGSNNTVDVDVRVIAATNKNLVKLIEQNKFREDLYYRLNVIPFSVTPLRERIQDIKTLVIYFIDKYSRLLNRRFTSIRIDEKVWEILYAYSWPGNVRELENTIEFIINMMDTDGVLTLHMIPENILNAQNKAVKKEEEVCSLKDIERNEIIKALKIYGHDTQGKKIAARKLGVGIATLYRKIDEYNLSK